MGEVLWGRNGRAKDVTGAQLDLELLAEPPHRVYGTCWEPQFPSLTPRGLLGRTETPASLVSPT